MFKLSALPKNHYRIESCMSTEEKDSSLNPNIQKHCVTRWRLASVWKNGFFIKDNEVAIVQFKEKCTY